jgi:Zinc carboxypeptidase
MRIATIALIVAAPACVGQARARHDVTTTAETSGMIATGRADEAVRLCHAIADNDPDAARCDQFGTSAEGRAMVALVLSRHGFDPTADARAHRPVILIEAGIHAGEIEGKDAGFMIARDVLAGTVAPGLLTAATVVFVPIFNVDGHERFTANNRPNQRGPIEMGFRTTAAALNLNRDWVKADAPEMVALLQLWQRWDPTVFVDLHTTDGAKFEHDVAVLVEPRTGRGDGLDRVGVALESALIDRVTALGHLPLSFYPSFDADDDPTSGFSMGDAPPRFSHYYATARGRIGILVETHSWRSYGERVHATADVLQALFEQAVAVGRTWRDAADGADLADAALAGRDVVLMSRADDQTRIIAFRGYHYQRVPSEVSGGTWIQYDEHQPEIWNVPLHDHLTPSLTVSAPGAGYVVTGGYAAIVAERLDRHGLRYQPVAPDAPLAASVWRVEHPEAGRTFEGRTTFKITGGWQPEARSAGRGAIFVPMAQPHGRLLLHLFEPSAPDALVNWGFFNAVLEQKEYMEAYVAEEVARTMLVDPAVKSAFDQALRDPAFAASPALRLDWFYRRSPAWDERVGLLPVMRVDVAPPTR